MKLQPFRKVPEQHLPGLRSTRQAIATTSTGQQTKDLVKVLFPNGRQWDAHTAREGANGMDGALKWPKY